MKPRTPKTKRQGELAAIHMLLAIDTMNWEYPIEDEKKIERDSIACVDAAIQAAGAWSDEARNGFTSVIGEWLLTEVCGAGEIIEDYCKQHGVRYPKRGPDTPIVEIQRIHQQR